MLLKNVSQPPLQERWAAMMETGQQTVTRKMTFSEFSESCRANFIDTKHGTLNHEGNCLQDDTKINQKLYLHKDVSDEQISHKNNSTRWNSPMGGRWMQKVKKSRL